jgi:RNA polymerase sigma-70 factor (ECF subfamily)
MSTVESRLTIHPQERNAALAKGTWRAARAAGRRTRASAARPHAFTLDEVNVLKSTESQGDLADFLRVWDTEKTYLYALCLRWTGDPDDAQDALGRSAFKALEMLREQRPIIMNYRAWLTRLIRNLCIDMRREQRTYSRALERFALEDHEPPPSSARHPEEEHLHREIEHRVRDAIRALPLKLREPCELRFLEELSYDEIAERLGVSNEAARKRIQQARVLLQDELSAHLDGVRSTAVRESDAGR